MTTTTEPDETPTAADELNAVDAPADQELEAESEGQAAGAQLGTNPVEDSPEPGPDDEASEGVDLLPPACECTPAGCSWKLCEHDEASWEEVGEPLVIEGEELLEIDAPLPPADFYGTAPEYDVVFPEFVAETTAAPSQTGPEMLAETGAPVDGWQLIVIGAALVFGGAAVAVSRWIGEKR